MQAKLRAVLDRFYRQETDLSVLALCRIAFGSSLFLHYLSMISYYQTAFGPDGLSGIRFLINVPIEPTTARTPVQNFQIFQMILDPRITTLFFVLLMFCALFYAIGFRARVFGSVALTLHLLFHSQTEFAFWGWAELIKPFMAYTLLWPGVSACYSVETWLKRRKGIEATSTSRGPIWHLRLLQCHVITVYVVVGWARISDPNWLDGSMLYGILTDTFFSRIDSEWRTLMGAIRSFGYFSWGIELFAPVGLLWRKTRTSFALALIVMHIGLEALAMVGYWNVIMVAALLSFVPISTLRNRLFNVSRLKLR